MKAFLTGILLILVTNHVKANVGLGTMKTAGNSCRSSISEAKLEKGKLQIPLALILKKTSNQGLQRGTCMVSLPMIVDSSHRLKLKNLKAAGLANIKKQSTSKLNLEVFRAGDRTEALTSSLAAIDKDIDETISLSRNDVLVTSCGESLILRINAAVILTGKMDSQLQMDNLEMEAVVEDCP